MTRESRARLRRRGRHGRQLRNRTLLRLALLLRLRRQRRAGRTASAWHRQKRIDRIERRQHRLFRGSRDGGLLFVKVNFEILLAFFWWHHTEARGPQQIDDNPSRRRDARRRHMNDRHGSASNEHIGRRLRADIWKLEHHACCSISERRHRLGGKLAVSGERDAGAVRFRLSTDAVQGGGEASRLHASASRQSCRRRTGGRAQRERAVEVHVDHIALAAHLMRRRLRHSDPDARDPRAVGRLRVLDARACDDTRRTQRRVDRGGGIDVAKIDEQCQRVGAAGEISHRLGCLNGDGGDPPSGLRRQCFQVRDGCGGGVGRGPECRERHESGRPRAAQHEHDRAHNPGECLRFFICHLPTP